MSVLHPLKEPVQELERDLDPNVRQRRASDPDYSVWVGASAGTGKTKVLTDRVLRLLLPRKDGRAGTPAHRILCLTFTRAGASEMLQRINQTLSVWATMPLEDKGADQKGLKTRLRELTGYEPAQRDIVAARRLIATVVDTPGGLKIMTIHSFCQSILGRFPLEAGLSPHFNVIDESRARELLIKARDTMLCEARKTPDSPLGQAVRAIAIEQNEEQFGKLLEGLCRERRQLATKVADDFESCLFQTLGLEKYETEDFILHQACLDENFDKAGLYEVCKVLANGGKRDQNRGIALQRWLDATPAEREETMEIYQKCFLTQKEEINKQLVSKVIADAPSAIENCLLREAQRLIVVLDWCKAAKCATMTRDLMLLGQEIIKEYQTLKTQHAALDYDDLILRTLSLLDDTDMAPWVLYKLDGGLDHILIDEAQDTNPEQWKIISRLCEDFFSGSGARDQIRRTVFTVGDEKQSIYSFQRAAPQEFERMRLYFAEKAKTRDEKLVISFRSVKSVLALVDEVFAPSSLREGMGQEIIKHESFRRGQAGLVALWPLCMPEETPDEAPWTPPVTIRETPSGQGKMAEKIGTTIQQWLDRGERIESLDRAIKPGDIMILVRTRTAFVGQLVRALKTRHIPVSGVDRMVLGEQIAVMDLLALAQFALLPADDLSLACALKSPLIGLDEDQLYELAIDRQGTLWQSLQSSPHKEIVSWLEKLVGYAAVDHPYEFFARLLQAPCPADTRSGLRAVFKRLGEDARDPLDEFLNTALSYERDHIPTLQGFLVWQQQGDITIKRELEEAGQAVRIMTVHGAKGLQAPVVILPDTTRHSSSNKISTLLWPDKTGLDVPLWSPRSADFPSIYQKARARYESYLEEEYRRLLYVAMTRAEDRLYIGGYKGRKEPIEECWYNYIAAAFDRMEGVEKDHEGVKFLMNPQIRAPDRAEKITQDVIKEGIPERPSWLFKTAPAEPQPPQSLVPSRPSQPEPAMRSPLAQGEEHRFKRGNITHRLLQLLPPLPVDRRRKAAAHFVAFPGHNLPQNLQRDIVDEIMDILENPDYKALFAEGSLAEVPITGMVKNRLVSAQIDRLLITDHEVLIVDYKTNRPPPHDEKDIPLVYREQMTSYRDIIQMLYPDKKVKCYLLWTDGPLLMPLEKLSNL